MSIKDLFQNQQVLNTKSEEIFDQIESKEYLDKLSLEKQEYIPDLDFSEPSNFARYGLATEYYTYAYNHIQLNYPYDGSEKEVTDWKNKLTYLEKYVFENTYPKATGYVALNTNTTYSAPEYASVSGGIFIAQSNNPQYIKFSSGPNAYGDIYKGGNIYNEDKKRTANINITPNEGNAVEFWFKLNNNIPNNAISCSFGLFDAWNGEETTNSEQVARFLVDITPISGVFSVTYQAGFSNEPGFDVISGIERLNFQYDVNEITNWHHYAFSVKNEGDAIKACFYVDGKLISEKIDGDKIGYINNRGINANIGAYIFSPFYGTLKEESKNQGSVPGSFDEFRYWNNTARSERDFARYRFTRIYGGTNTDLSNINLGVYFRFNEGIFSSTEFDSRDNLVLDYSGRVSNGTIINNDISVRQSGSAIDDSGQFESAEPKDVIIFSTHPTVISSLNTLLEKANVWDINNNTAIYKSFPEWITSEDEKIGVNDLKKLSQIMASYFDKLYLQIKFLSKNEFANYLENDTKPVPFINTILESNGFVAPDLFIDASIIEGIKSRDEKRLFEDKIYDLKNLIYKNIYNNLTYIYKTKGSEKSYRNLLRCFGIDDELIKLNIYANNTEFSLENNKKDTVIKKRILNLSTPDTFFASLFNTHTDTDGVNSFSFVSPTLSGSTTTIPSTIVPLTFETEIYFPKKPDVTEQEYYVPDSLTIALFGGSSVNNSAVNNDYTIKDEVDYYNFDVTLEKNSKDARGGYFKFNCKTTNEVLTSSYFFDLYEGDKWNFAVRLKVPYENLNRLRSDITAFSQTPVDDTYNLELYAVSSVEDNIKNEFILTSSALTIEQVANIHSFSKRFYIGAKKNNFTGSLIYPTDIQVTYGKFWFDYLTNDEITEHSKDPENFGRKNPRFKRYEALFDKTENIDTLGFSWEFDTLKKSDNSGVLFVDDVKPRKIIDGSIFVKNVTTTTPAIVSETLPNNEELVNYKHTIIAKQQIPENVYSTSTVNVLGESDFVFTKDSRPISFYWAFEKSMYQTISEEMLKMFATISDFNNLIGEPINLYRKEYRDLQSIRRKFFDKIDNTPSLEKYLEYYKWIDSSVGVMLNELAPAGAEIAKNVRNIVESHALERTKLQNNTARFTRNELDYAQIKGIKELKYNWSSGHAPEDLNNIDQEASALWLKERAERSNTQVFTSAGTTANVAKQTILDSIVNQTNKKASKVYDAGVGTIYNRTTYYERRLARIVDIIAKYPETPADIIDIYNVENIKNTLENTVELRPIASGSEFARTSLYNQERANYSKLYEVFNIPGREINKKYFIETNGQFSASNSSPFISGVVDRQLPNRTRYEAIMANKFSSPGGPEVHGAGYLDRESESLSPYNTLNYRNNNIRQNLNVWQKNTSSVNENFPSFHKINKNRFIRPNKDYYDNGFVVHQIPRTDYGYYWISNAVTGVLTSSGPYSSFYPNIALGELAILTASYEDSSIIDFAGITNTFYTKSIDEYLTKQFTPATELHKYLLKENGPTTYSSWKQVRGSQNKTLIKLPRKNKYLIRNFVSVPSRVRSRNASSLATSGISRLVKKDATEVVYEPVVEWNYPLELFVLANASFKDVLSLLGENISVASTNVNAAQTNEQTKQTIFTEYSNELDWFANPTLKRALTFLGKNNFYNITYKKIYNLYTSEIQDEKEPFLLSLTYKELIYPKKQNVSLAKVRNKDSYSEQAGVSNRGYDRQTNIIRSFWKNDLSNRLRTKAISLKNEVQDLLIDDPMSNKIPVYFGAVNSFNYASLHTFFSNSVQYNVKILGNTNTSSLTLVNDLSNSVDTIWTLDNSASYTLNQGAFQITQSNFIAGELGAYKEFELRNAVLAPQGSNSGINFLYDNFYYRTLPKPQAVFINHFPSRYDQTKPWYEYNINGGMQYLTDIISENKPWYNSYDEFSEDIRPHTQNYSVIPEFKISDHMLFYILEKNGDFSAPIKYNYLNLDGIEVENKFILNSEVTTTGENIVIENKKQEYIDQQYFSTDIFASTVNTENEALVVQSSLKINVDSILKLLPYSGFYPNQKAMQIAGLFSNSFFGLSPDNIMFDALPRSSVSEDAANGAPADQQIMTVMQPFFAPGVLFNSLRSGIAVDWPTYIKNDVDYSSSMPPSFYSTASSEALTQNNLNYVLDGNFTHRFKLNSLFDIENSIPRNLKENTLYYLNPTFYASDVVSGSDRNNLRYPLYKIEYTEEGALTGLKTNWRFNDPLFTLAINNFMAEIPNFFLKNSRLTSIFSAPSNEFKPVISGTTYFMDVHLSKSEKINLFGFTDVSDWKAGHAASMFGPPSKYFTSGKILADYGSKGADEYNHEDLFIDAAFAPYLPPYYFGGARARLSFKAPRTGQPTLEEIFNNLTITYYNTPLQQKLKSITDDKFSTATAFANKMNLDACLNFTQKTNQFLVQRDRYGNPTSINDPETQALDVWSIQTIFEAPILNFNTTKNNSMSSEQNFVADKGSYSNIVNISNDIGLWSGYGEPTTVENSIKLKIEPSNENDLATICGFNLEQSQDVGLIAQTREVSEAVVMIPYSIANLGPEFAKINEPIFGENNYNGENPDKFPKYFSVNKSVIAELLKLQDVDFSDQERLKYDELEKIITNLPSGNSIVDTMKFLIKYNVPPHLNWIRNRNIEPFVMYFAEFSLKLDEANKDISNIWQGVMPEAAKKVSLKTNSIEHSMTNTEFFHGLKIPEKLQFKVFKVKKRALTQYSQIVNNSKDDSSLKVRFKNSSEINNLEYNYNYPYDDFSIIELCKVKIELKNEVKE